MALAAIAQFVPFALGEFKAILWFGECMSNEMTKLNRTAETTLKAPCAKCKRQTNHKVLASADLLGTWEYDGHGLRRVIFRVARLIPLF